MQDKKSNSSIRKVIGSVLAFFEEIMIIDNRQIPMFFGITGSSQRYVNATYFRDAQSGQEISDIVTLPLPRGILTANSFSIDNASRTNPYVRAEMREMIDGKIEMVSKKLRVVPITLPMTLKFTTSSIIEMLQIFEKLAIIPESKLAFYYYDFGIQVGGTIQFPDSYDKNIPFEWTASDDRTLIQELDVEVNSSLLSPDNLSKRHMGKKIKEFESNIMTRKFGETKTGILPKNVRGIDSPFN
jgi:hypothetical protein